MAKRIVTYLSIIIIVSSITTLHAQVEKRNQLGLYCGAYFNVFGSNNGHVSSNYDKRAYRQPISFLIGAKYGIILGKKITLNTGLYYSQYKFINAYYAAVEDMVESEWRMKYFCVPIDLHFLIDNDLYLLTGYILELLLDASNEEKYAYYDEIIFSDNITNELQKVNHSIVFGFGKNINIRGGKYYVETKYSYSFGQYEYGTLKVRRNNNVQIDFGIMLGK